MRSKVPFYLITTLNSDICVYLQCVHACSHSHPHPHHCSLLLDTFHTLVIAIYLILTSVMHFFPYAFCQFTNVPLIASLNVSANLFYPPL